MTKPSSWVRSALGGALVLASACAAEAPSAGLPYFDSPEFTPRWVEPPPADFHRIPAFSLVDQHGAEVTEADLAGKVAVVDFFFTSCQGICPQLAEGMARIDGSISADAPMVLLSHSVMPGTDTVPTLARYADQRGITSERWHLLTGDRQVIYDLGRTAYFVEEELGIERTDDDFLHTENIVLVDAEGHLRGVYNGLNATSVAQLVTDAEALLGAM
ncbi:MAG: protein SCO1/2 [Myxococcota bacterium]|jgi:protein SCO1/2